MPAAAGIAAFGAYVPLTRLPLAMIAGAKPKEGGPEKAVAYYDEDAITMGVAAALDCLGDFDRSRIDALYFASTTHALAEKQSAAIVARALDLRRDVHTVDTAGSLRAGTSALESALHAVAAGAAQCALVVASDCRLGAPRGALEGKLGDGAAAFLVSADGVQAEWLGSFAVSDELQDQWRTPGERFTHSWEDRFVITEGYTPNVKAALEGLLGKTGLSAGDLARVALVGPDARSLGGAAKAAGVKPDQLQDPLFGKLGHTGAAFGPMLLCAALEAASPGDAVAAIAYGDGAHALAFRATDAQGSARPRRGVAGHMARRRSLKSYDSYLKSRGLDPKEWEAGADLGLSATIRFRERDADISLAGARCGSCGQVQIPQPRVCVSCHAKDDWERVRLSDKPGRLLAYTFDFFFPAAEPPTIMIMTEVEGCRLQVQLADTAPDEVRLDMPVEYVFRKIHDAGGKPNYFWKASPLGDANQAQEAA